jgi:hypothetical protein
MHGVFMAVPSRHFFFFSMTKGSPFGLHWRDFRILVLCFGFILLKPVYYGSFANRSSSTVTKLHIRDFFGARM